MPLLIITGLPCSGKTHRAQQLAAEFSSRTSADPSTSAAYSHLRILHLPSYHASADSTTPSTGPSLRDQIYNSAKEEKTARAEEFSAIKRAVSKDVLVIADGSNYIKGYRYQLWCEAKASGTRCCVVHVAAREDECKAWNDERLRAVGRGEEIEVPEDQEEGATERPNMLGDMLPESHTAIYGDRVITSVSRSRSSSMNAQSDQDGEGSPRAEDAMTLKSLYIRDRPGAAQYEERKDEPKLAPKSQSLKQPSISTESRPTASSTPPPPNSSPPYCPATLTSLCMRYEPPSPFSRWDTPLFTIPTSDPHPPYTSIWAALFPLPTTRVSKKALSQSSTSQPRLDETSTATVDAVKRHASTILPPSAPSTALQTLEATTQLVTTSLLSAYRSSPLFSPTHAGYQDHDGGPLRFHIAAGPPAAGSAIDKEIETGIETDEYEITLPPGLVLSQPMLQRLRRKYTSLQRGGIAHGVVGSGVRGGRKGVVEGFVRFLGDEWGVGDG